MKKLKSTAFFTFCYKNKEKAKKTALKYTHMYSRIFKVALQILMELI